MLEKANEVVHLSEVLVESRGHQKCFKQYSYLYFKQMGRVHQHFNELLSMLRTCQYFVGKQITIKITFAKCTRRISLPLKRSFKTSQSTFSGLLVQPSVFAPPHKMYLVRKTSNEQYDERRATRSEKRRLYAQVMAFSNF